VRDLVIHGDDLVIGTFGRGFWIMDNITPLRQAGDATAASDAILFQPANAVRLNPEGFFGTPFPPEEPQAKNPPDGAVIDYYLKVAGAVTLEILDGKGAVVKKYSSADGPPAPRAPQPVADYWLSDPPRLTGKAGHNRFAWDLRYALPAQYATQGPLVLPGTYQVKLTAAGRSYTKPLVVTKDPRSTATPLELQKQFDLSISILRDIQRVNDAFMETTAARRQVAGTDVEREILRIAGIGGGGRGGAGAEPGATLASVSQMLSTALSVAGSADRTPPATAYELAATASQELTRLLAEWKVLRESKLTAR
jgi:hypothetical protein